MVLHLGEEEEDIAQCLSQQEENRRGHGGAEKNGHGIPSKSMLKLAKIWDETRGPSNPGYQGLKSCVRCRGQPPHRGHQEEEGQEVQGFLRLTEAPRAANNPDSIRQ